MRLALVLLIALTALYTIGQLAPDPTFDSTVSPGAKQFRPGGLDATLAQPSPLRRIYESPVALGITCLLVINLSVCTTHRALQLLRRKPLRRSPDAFSYLADRKDHSKPSLKEIAVRRGRRIVRPLSSPHLRSEFSKDVSLTLAEAIARLEDALLSKRYTVDVQTDQSVASVYAEKGRMAAWGSTIFHASLLIVLVGAAYGELTSFKGIAVMAEGQTFTEKHDEYVVAKEAAFFSEDRHQGFSVKLNRFTPVYKDWYPVDARSDVAVMEGDRVVREYTIRINSPLKYKGVSFLLDRDGFTPLFTIKDKDGRVVMANWVNLKIGKSSHEEDTFELPGFDYRVAVRIYPDFVMDGDRMSSKSFLPNNPVLYLQIYSAEGDLLGEGPLALRQSVQLGNFWLTFQDLRYWNSFRIVRNDGEPVLILGFVLALSGLAMRFLFIQKRVWAYAEANGQSTRVHLRGKVSHFDELFVEEFQEIADGLEEKNVPDVSEED